MKKINILLLFLSFALVGYSQLISENKDYELKDSIGLTKDEIYAKTKYYIADKWISANNVIQLDDEKTGIILIKGTINRDITRGGRSDIYIWSYTIEFRMKDNMFKIGIKEIRNSEHIYSGSAQSSSTFLYLSYNTEDNCAGIMTVNVPKKYVVAEMLELDNYFEGVLVEYKNALISKADAFDDF